MKRALKDHLPGGPNPPRPTSTQLLAVHRCIAIYREQKRRIADDGANLEQLAAAVGA
jgi:hypothetical protein